MKTTFAGQAESRRTRSIAVVLPWPVGLAIMNKPSSVDSKEKLLRFHIVPRLGKLRLDEVTYAVISTT